MPLGVQKTESAAITFDSYEMLVRRHLKPALGHVPLRDLRPEQLQHIYNEKVKEGISATTTRLHHVILSNALAQAEKNALVARNVCRLVELPRQTRQEMKTLTLEQIKNQLLPAIEHDRFFAAIYIDFTTGLRRGELLALRWCDVDLKLKVLHVRQTLVRASNRTGYIGTTKTQLVFQEPKTEASRRTVALTDEAIVVLRKHKAEQAEERLKLGAGYHDLDLVFCQADGKPVDTRNFNQYFTQVLHRAGLPHIRLHDLRHTYATLLFEQGVHPKVVQSILGHTSIAITLDVYSHVSSELEQQTAEKLNAALTSELL